MPVSLSEQITVSNFPKEINKISLFISDHKQVINFVDLHLTNTRKKGTFYCGAAISLFKQGFVFSSYIDHAKNIARLVKPSKEIKDLTLSGNIFDNHKITGIKFDKQALSPEYAVTLCLDYNGFTTSKVVGLVSEQEYNHYFLNSNI